MRYSYGLGSECVHMFYLWFNEAVVEVAEIPSPGEKFVCTYHIYTSNHMHVTLDCNITYNIIHKKYIMYIVYTNTTL